MLTSFNKKLFQQVLKEAVIQNTTTLELERARCQDILRHTEKTLVSAQESPSSLSKWFKKFLQDIKISDHVISPELKNVTTNVSPRNENSFFGVTTSNPRWCSNLWAVSRPIETRLKCRVREQSFIHPPTQVNWSEVGVSFYMCTCLNILVQFLIPPHDATTLMPSMFWFWHNSIVADNYDSPPSPCFDSDITPSLLTTAILHRWTVCSLLFNMVAAYLAALVKCVYHVVTDTVSSLSRTYIHSSCLQTFPGSSGMALTLL